MKEKNEHNAMSVSKRLALNAFGFALTLAWLGCGVTGAAHAQETKVRRSGFAPTLYELREVFVDYPYFSDPKTSSDCGLTRESILTVLQRNLQDPGLEIMTLNESHARQGARVNLRVEILTIKEGKNCWSWVFMPFTDKAPVMLPPVKVARMMTLLFWEDKKLAASAQERHPGVVNDMISAMARLFLRDVKLAIPSVTMSAHGDKEESDKEAKDALRLKALNDSVSQKLIKETQEMPIPEVGGKKN